MPSHIRLEGGRIVNLPARTTNVAPSTISNSKQKQPSIANRSLIQNRKKIDLSRMRCAPNASLSLLHNKISQGRQHGALNLTMARPRLPINIPTNYQHHAAASNQPLNLSSTASTTYQQHQTAPQQPQLPRPVKCLVCNLVLPSKKFLKAHHLAMHPGVALKSISATQKSLLYVSHQA
jgi:hypothetical protein